MQMSWHQTAICGQPFPGQQFQPPESGDGWAITALSQVLLSLA